MSYYAFKNNLKATLHYDMTDTDTVIWLKQLVTSTDPDTRLAAWPTCDASHTFTLTLESTEDSKIREIVECTGVTANTTDYIAFSCTRAKENTVAIAHNKNATNVENRITAAALTAIADALTTTVASVTANTASISTYMAGLAGKMNADCSNADLSKCNIILQRVRVNVSTFAQGSTITPADNTVPQITEGDQYMQLALTPKSATSKLRVDVVCNYSNSGSTHVVTALFRDSAVNAIAAVQQVIPTGTWCEQSVFSTEVVSGSTATTTFKVRMGPDNGTLSFNGRSGAQTLGGVTASSITITEFAA